jgi:3-dehydroquinate synthase class II
MADVINGTWAVDSKSPRQTVAMLHSVVRPITVRVVSGAVEAHFTVPGHGTDGHFATDVQAKDSVTVVAQDAAIKLKAGESAAVGTYEIVLAPWASAPAGP